MSAEDQPQRPQALAGTHWNQSRPLRTPCCGWCAAHTAALREKSSRRARISPLLWSPADEQTIIANTWLLVPEGRRRKLAGGKPAQRARPPVAPPNGPCPSGASKKFLAASAPLRFRHPSAPRAFFFDAPLGHGAKRHRFRGRRPLPRTCPRLISSGVPPGRKTGGRAQPRKTPGVRMAFQTRPVAAPPRFVHRASVSQQQRPH